MKNVDPVEPEEKNVQELIPAMPDKPESVAIIEPIRNEENSRGQEQMSSYQYDQMEPNEIINLELKHSNYTYNQNPQEIEIPNQKSRDTSYLNFDQSYVEYEKQIPVEEPFDPNSLLKCSTAEFDATINHLFCL